MSYKGEFEMQRYKCLPRHGRHGLLCLLLASVVLLCSCGSTVGPSSGAGSTSTDGSAGIQTVADVSAMFTDRDKEIGYDESAAALIRLEGDTARCDSDAVQISGGTVTITDEGTYILSGTLDNGMLIVQAEATDKLQLVLDGVTIACETSAALYIREADKVFITTAPDSVNTLSNGGSYTAIDENNIDAVLFSKADLTLNGSGELIINAAAGHGVVSKDDLVITSGTYLITAASHGLSGKDSIRIAGGELTIDAGKDGIQAENADDASLGFLYIADGTFAITADGDGLSAGSYAQLDGGEYTLLTGGGSANAASQGNDFGGAFGSISSSSENSTSAKGIKAAGDLVINTGTFFIDAADDALHSNANLSVNGGEFQIATGDDGLHADSALTIASGVLRITESYEGLEGQSVTISGGEIDVVASDDGINAAGGNDESGFDGFGGGFRGPDSFDTDADAFIVISDGSITLNASGDGIDSNGSLTVSGGTVILSGPDNGGNGALDYGTQAVISGGVFMAAGNSQMAQNFGSSSTQGVMMVTVSTQQAGSVIRLTDSNGQELVSWEAEKAFDSVIISCPEITQGSLYTLNAGSDEVTVTMDSLVYTSGGMGDIGGMEGGMQHGFNQRAPR